MKLETLEFGDHKLIEAIKEKKDKEILDLKTVMERKDEQHTQHCKFSPLAWRDRGYAIKENDEN